jgi:hypothetical protein
MPVLASNPGPGRSPTARHHPPQELLPQPRLAHAGLALQQDDAALTLDREPPGLGQGGPGLLPPDQARLEGRGPHVPLLTDRPSAHLPGVGLHPAHQVGQAAGRLAAGLLVEDGAIVGEARQGGTPVPREVTCLDGQPGGLVGERVAGQPPLCQLHRLAPAPLPHGLSGETAERLGVLLEQPEPGLRDPFLEPGGMANRKTSEEGGDVEGDGLAGRGGERAAELDHVAGDRLGQPHVAPVARTASPTRVRRCLSACRSEAGLPLGRFAPKEAGQLFPGVGRGSSTR